MIYRFFVRCISGLGIGLSLFWPCGLGLVGLSTSVPDNVERYGRSRWSDYCLDGRERAVADGQPVVREGRPIILFCFRCMAQVRLEKTFYGVGVTRVQTLA